MGSRVRENPEHMFEFFAEVAKPDHGQDAFILQSYPPDFKEEDVLKSVPKFAFPCVTEGATVDHFTFVLTDLESKYRFGFCRHATGAQTCLCIMSFLPWYEIFYNLLNHLAEILNRNEDNDVEPLLRAAYVHEPPRPSLPVTIVAHQEMFSFSAPDMGKLPSIPSSRNLTEYYNAVDATNMLKIFASMLNERRVLVTSRKLSRLTACVHGAAALLYPMHWQHLYIPVLPEHLIDYCSAPMPFIIGIHSTLMKKLRNIDVGDAVIVDADNNTVVTEYDDLDDLPQDVVAYLKKHLRGPQTDKSRSPAPLTGDAISKTFLNALVKLIGGYRDALRFRPGEPITFDPEAFVQTRTASMQAFLENMLHLQIFQQFINDRLDMLNCGNGFTDLFEREATLQGDKLNTQSRYKDWLVNMKKQGKRLQRGGKDVWSDFKKRMKSQGHKAYKGIRSKIGNINKEEPSPFKVSQSIKSTPLSKQLGRARPTTIVGTELKMSRPARPLPPSGMLRSSSSGDRPLVQMSSSRERASKHYQLLTLNEKSLDDAELALEYNRISINLINDPDIQHAMRKSVSMEDIKVKIGIRRDSLSSTDQSTGSNDTPPEFEPHHVPLIDNDNEEENSDDVCSEDVTVYNSRNRTFDTVTTTASVASTSSAPPRPPRPPYPSSHHQEPPPLLKRKVDPAVSTNTNSVLAQVSSINSMANSRYGPSHVASKPYHPVVTSSSRTLTSDRKIVTKHTSTTLSGQAHSMQSVCKETTTHEAIHLDHPPIPAPRRRSPRNITKTPALEQKRHDVTDSVEKHLIRLDSSGSESDMTQFDPLAVKTTELRPRTSISRCPAFRKAPEDIPKRHSVFHDTSPDSDSNVSSLFAPHSRAAPKSSLAANAPVLHPQGNSSVTGQQNVRRIMATAFSSDPPPQPSSGGDKRFGHIFPGQPVSTVQATVARLDHSNAVTSASISDPPVSLQSRAASSAPGQKTGEDLMSMSWNIHNIMAGSGPSTQKSPPRLVSKPTTYQPSSSANIPYMGTALPQPAYSPSIFNKQRAQGPFSNPIYSAPPRNRKSDVISPSSNVQSTSQSIHGPDMSPSRNQSPASIPVLQPMTGSSLGQRNDNNSDPFAGLGDIKANTPQSSSHRQQWETFD